MAADAEAGGDTYVSALECLPEIHSVCGVSMRDLHSKVDEVKPDFVVLLLNERANVLRVLYQLLAPELRRHHVIAVLQGGSPEFIRVLVRLGVEPHVVKALDAEALQDKIRTRLSNGDGIACPPRPNRRSERGSIGTISLVEREIRQANVPLSAAEVSARCGLSTVTCRAYLNQLVSRRNVSMSTQHRSVGRPVNLYRWVG
ncbi:hypothetical protein Save01_07018 [Streptomyces avermitilis]|uniref:Response regulatory domain-containing protein n=1 Tax=Streptomyces avermitilis (strain ATCC 31267 / DSM 46492 / JCM 5070 / NBRC 14893 / NCIMB 12804 / NRRL 8165 / MA-4680) TaxID=227882 RepID=A0A143SZA1_STRAW|nr:hypothetical protein SAVERM_2p077 [Streptomyces avermitilis MA-4680 = NBRC 14893]